MPSLPASPPEVSRPAARQTLRAVPLLLIASAVLLLLGYFIYTLASAVGSAQPLRFQGAAFQLSKGEGKQNQGTLTVTKLTEQGVAVALLTPPTFQAKNYDRVEWHISDLSPDLRIDFLWRTVDDPALYYSARPLVLSSAAAAPPAPLPMLSDKKWHGEIAGMALVIKGKLTKPLVIQRVVIHPATGWQAHTNTLRQWFRFEGWKGSTINFTDANALDLEIAPLVAIAAWVLIALLLYAVLARFKLVNLPAAALWLIPLAGWVALDARWQANLFQQLQLTQQQYAGKSWEDRHLAAEDGALFFFTQQAEKLLPSARDNSRLFFLSDQAYLSGRGAYHLYPHNVMPSKNLPAAGQLKSGDYLVLFEKKGIRYDSAKKILQWDEAQSVRADVLMFNGQNALLRIP